MKTFIQCLLKVVKVDSIQGELGKCRVLGYNSPLIPKGHMGTIYKQRIECGSVNRGPQG